MQLGVCCFPTYDALSPAALARLVEERGQESLFFPDHTHIPASRESEWPAGGELPPWYWRLYELFVALSAAAGATSRLRIGSGVCLVPERDPIITAKQVASIDQLSGGRFELGVGAGWNREEMRNHGTDPRVRMAVLAERIEAMKAIWAQHEASYSGTYVSFERILCEPKPAQRPHPPILVGGSGPTVLERVLAYGDAWFPHWRDPDQIEQRTRELHARAERPIEVQVMGVPADPAAIERMRAAGVTRVLHWLPSAPRGPIERALEAWENAIAHFYGG